LRTREAAVWLDEALSHCSLSWLLHAYRIAARSPDHPLSNSGTRCYMLTES
jgi:hypothetical protein